MATTKVNSEFIAVNAISGTIIADGAITSTHLAANSVDTAELVTGSIDTIHIAANQVTSAKIVSDAVLTRHIADDQVTQALIAVNSVGISELAVTEGSDGQVLTTNGSGTLSFSTVSGTTINNNADNRVITGSGTANTLNGEANLTFGSSLAITKSEGAANSLNDQISLEHTSGTTGYHIKTIRAAANDNPDGIAFVENTTERMRIRGGNVGIGTASPVAPVTINDKATISFNSSDFVLGHQLYYDGAGNDRWERLTGNAGSAIYQTAGNILFYRTAAGGATGDAVTPSESLRIDSSGRVGIGTNSPGNGYGGSITAAKLAILSGAAGSNGGTSTILIGGDDKHYSYIQGTHTSSGLTELDFGTCSTAANPTLKMRLDATGRLAVGGTATSGSTGGVTVSSASAGYRHMYMWNSGMYFWNGSNEASLTSGGAFSNASDERLKENITDISYGLAEVKKLKPKKYNMKSGGEKQVGLIAQEVETIIPEVVTTSGEANMKSLSYGNLNAVLIKAIQEQQTIIDDLKSRIETLEG